MKSNNHIEEKFIRTQEVMEILGVKKTKFYTFIKEVDFIKPFKINGLDTKVYSYLELQEWMEKQERIPCN